MEQGINEINAESRVPDGKMVGLAITSMVLGVLSVCPSLGIIDLLRNPQGAGDFQGGGMIIVFMICGVALLGPASVVTGGVVLFNITVNKTVKKNLMIPAIIGLVLGLPSIVAIVLFLATMGS